MPGPPAVSDKIDPGFMESHQDVSCSQVPSCKGISRTWWAVLYELVGCGILLSIWLSLVIRLVKGAQASGQQWGSGGATEGSLNSPGKYLSFPLEDPGKREHGTSHGFLLLE